MKFFCACLLTFAATFVYSQSVPPPAAAPTSRPSVADFGLAYPLSTDWVRATEMLQNRVDPATPGPNFDILLAAVYVPKSSMSESSPFFSLRAYRPAATDCKKNLEAMIATSQDRKDHAEGGVEAFSAAGRDYFRVNLAHGFAGRHECVICTVAKGHLLVWNAGAPNDKGLDAIIATLDSITSLPEQSATEHAQAPESKDKATEKEPAKPTAARPERVRVSSGVVTGLRIKDVKPIYPDDARHAHIQGRVVLKAEISKTGDVTDLELVSGPIELAGSAVAAVRQWKFRPYMLMGEPVAVTTQIQVNYQLQ